MLAVLASGCDGGDRGGDARRQGAVGQDRTAAPRGSDGVAAALRPRGCPVTLHNTRVPPPGEAPPRQGLPANAYYANGRLWTILPPNGIIHEAPQRDGSIEVKFPWWRGVRGRLSVTSRRLDAPAPALRARILDGYGPIGFQATSIGFSSEGCWRVTGLAGTARLSFVTLVVNPGGQSAGGTL